MKIIIGKQYINKMTNSVGIVRKVRDGVIHIVVNGKEKTFRRRDFEHYFTDKSRKDHRIEVLRARIEEREQYITDYQRRIVEDTEEIRQWESGERT